MPTTDNFPANLNDQERTKCEIWCRCMGYHRPISAYNPGKQSEFRDRKWFTENRADHGVKT